MRLIQLSYKIPEHNILACSGGIDSMVALDFITRVLKKRTIIAYFNHGTVHGAEAAEFVKDYASEHNLTFITNSKIPSAPDVGESPENFWRIKRYEFFHSTIELFGLPLITCHHLDDQVETYLFGMLNGKERLIASSVENGKIIRPFLLTKKVNIIEWAKQNNLTWIQDPSNESTDYKRNFIRHVLLPDALEVNPGLYKTVAKKTNRM